MSLETQNSNKDYFGSSKAGLLETDKASRVIYIDVGEETDYRLKNGSIDSWVSCFKLELENSFGLVFVIFNLGI